MKSSQKRLLTQSNEEKKHHHGGNMNRNLPVGEGKDAINIDVQVPPTQYKQVEVDKDVENIVSELMKPLREGDPIPESALDQNVKIFENTKNFPICIQQV